MVRAKRIYILIINVDKLFSFSSSRCFLKEIENMYSVFLSSYRNTHESLGELEKAVETPACGSCSHSIPRSPILPLVFQQRDRNTVHVFYFLNSVNELVWYQGTKDATHSSWLELFTLFMRKFFFFLFFSLFVGLFFVFLFYFFSDFCFCFVLFGFCFP